LSALTKIFVVLLVVFCIAFTMSTISFVARTNEWRALAEGYQQEAQVSDTYLRNILAESAAQKALDRDAINAHIGRIKDIEADKQEALREIAGLKAELSQARAEISSLQGTARTLSGELKVGQAGWAEQRKQRELLQERNLELEKRNLDLNERVNEQTAQVMVLQQELRRREQQVQILREENRNLAQAERRRATGEFEAYSPAEQEKVRPVTAVAESPIRGRITEVSGGLATISVGSADGVAEGMVFVIYRGLDYIGDLKISKVEPSQSAGKIVRSTGTVLAGDAVADEARFGMAQ
jgi:peptidoglycan hydrolase CwlO-like protein